MVAPLFEWKDFEDRDVIDFIFGYSMLLYTDIHRILHKYLDMN